MKLSESTLILFFFYSQKKVAVLARYGGITLYYEKATEQWKSSKKPIVVNTATRLSMSFTSNSEHFKT